MTRIAILQSNYIPWKGYFDLIASVDAFLFYDEVQYTKNDWRNRNRIKTPQGTQWLTIPVGDAIHRRIDAVAIREAGCGDAHWRRLAANYARAAHFRAVAAWLEPLYRDRPWTHLSTVNRRLVAAICEFLDIRTTLGDTTDHAATGDRNDRLLSICRAAGADVYVSGPAARSYLDVDAFAAAGIAVEWMDYRGYPEYRQLWGPFVHEVSIVDLLFNCGIDARHAMKSGAP